MIDEADHDNYKKLVQLAEKHGFIDSDCPDFGMLIIKECIAAIDPEGDLTSMHEEIQRNACIRMIKEHFGIKTKKIGV